MKYQWTFFGNSASEEENSWRFNPITVTINDTKTPTIDAMVGVTILFLRL